MRGDNYKLMKIEELMEPQMLLESSGEEKATKEDSPDEKSVVPFQPPDDQHPPLVVEKKAGDTGSESFSSGFIDKDTEMAKVETEKRLALIKAWEDNEKAKAENRAYKKMTLVESWEDKKKAELELEMKKIEEKLEKIKARHQEKQKNKVAELQKAANEKRAAIEAQCGRNIVDIVGKSDRYRASGQVPKKFAKLLSSIGC